MRMTGTGLTANFTVATGGVNGYTISGINSTGDIYAETNYGVEDPATTGALAISGLITTSKDGGSISLSNTLTDAQYGIQLQDTASLSASGDITLATGQSSSSFTNNGIELAGSIHSDAGNIYIYDNRNYGPAPDRNYAANMNITGSISTNTGNISLEDFGAGIITIAEGAILDGGSNTPLSLLSDNGSIAQTGGVIQSEVTADTGIQLTAYSGSISLTGGTISEVSGGNIIISTSGEGQGTGAGMISSAVGAILTETDGGNLTLQSDTGVFEMLGVVSSDSSTNLFTSGNISLSNGANQLTGGVTATGANVTLVTSGDLGLDAIDASGNVTLAADHLMNQGGSGAITTGEENVWNIYLTDLEGNTFDGLKSNHQAIWGTAYPTTISQSGNRYIFATTENLNLNAIAGSMNLSSLYGVGTTLQTPTEGTNYRLGSFFVDASRYGDVFVQDTVANVLNGNLNFSSEGSSSSAKIGTYNINMSGVSTTGYHFIMDDPYGTLSVIQNPEIEKSLEIANPALAGANIVNQIPLLGGSGQVLMSPTRESIKGAASEINPDLQLTE